MADIPNLWPEDFAEDVQETSPFAILQRQAQELTQRTRGQIWGDVQRGVHGDRFEYTFNLRAPALDYSYELFDISHGIEFYPLHYHFESQRGEADNEQEFYEWLKGVFAAERTRKIIGRLLRQISAL